MTKKTKERAIAKLIFNPRAGKKRQVLPLQTNITLEDIERLLTQYQISYDCFPTKSGEHASQLARNAKSEGYKMVIVAGGDGTVGEVLSEIVKTDITLAILPLGSFMNIARMLSLPRELEAAVAMIKIGRVRKIDVGCITHLGGQDLANCHYFIEESGIGIEAEMHYYLTGIYERREYLNWFKIVWALWQFYYHRVRIFIDGKQIETNATMVSVSNGPVTAASLIWEPKSRLNDNKLTVRAHKLSRREITLYLLKLLFKKKAASKKIRTYQAKTVRIETKGKKLIHADARVFGTTPVEYKVIPNALKVITGFPKKEEQEFLKKRTYLDP